MGSDSGEIAIYYIDEPIVNPITRQKEVGRFKQVLHTYFNFFTRAQAPKEGEEVPSLEMHKNSKSRLSKTYISQNKNDNASESES